jgi:hypothetical protein
MAVLTRMMVVYESWNFAKSLPRTSVVSLRSPSVARTRQWYSSPE